jgi:hypothetical protein
MTMSENKREELQMTIQGRIDQEVEFIVNSQIQGSLDDDQITSTMFSNVIIVVDDSLILNNKED